MPMSQMDLETLLQTMAGGGRRGNTDQAAVRLGDIKGILQIDEQQSVQVTGTVTAAQYNVLVGDITTIFNALIAVSAALRDRSDPTSALTKARLR